jgi:1-acyl-sn-glycerol-3-phosphate acyltransferase
MSAAAGGLVRVFFSDLEVTGGARVPAGGPTILVANHYNGLVDGLVLIAVLGRYPRFLGKSTLWKIAPIRPLLALAGVIPIYRAADVRRGPGGASGTERAKRNEESFARCRQLLASGAMVAVFPEGISHDEPRVQELRTGAARIALGAAGDDGTPGVVIVPAGLVYDDKSRFRSRALVRIGTPRPVDPAVPGYRSDGPASVHALTAQVAADLGAVADDAGLAVFDSAPSGGDAGKRGRLQVARSVLEMAGAIPLAGAGVAIHLVPYTIVKAVAKLPANVGVRASVKLLGCLGLFTLTYAALAVRVGLRRGIPAGVTTFFAAPVCGYVALLSSERLDAMGGVAARSRRAFGTSGQSIPYGSPPKR